MDIKSIKLRLAHAPKNPMVFKLGPGPCSRTVLSLDTNITEVGVYITQLCEDGRYDNSVSLAEHTKWVDERTAAALTLAEMGHILAMVPPPHYIDSPDTFFYPMAQVLECRVYRTEEQA